MIVQDDDLTTCGPDQDDVGQVQGVLHSVCAKVQVNHAVSSHGQ